MTVYVSWRLGDIHMSELDPGRRTDRVRERALSATLFTKRPTSGPANHQRLRTRPRKCAPRPGLCKLDYPML
jgi:hypothetical protein